MFHTEESLREALTRVNERSMAAIGIAKTHLTDAEYDELHLPDADDGTAAQCSGLDVTPEALRGAATALGSFTRCSSRGCAAASSSGCWSAFRLRRINANEKEETMATEEKTGEKVYVYRDHADEWRWTKVAANGEVIADSGEGYANRQHARDRAEAEAHGAEIIDGERPPA